MKNSWDQHTTNYVQICGHQFVLQLLQIFFNRHGQKPCDPADLLQETIGSFTEILIRVDLLYCFGAGPANIEVPQIGQSWRLRALLSLTRAFLSVIFAVESQLVSQHGKSKRGRLEMVA